VGAALAPIGRSSTQLDRATIPRREEPLRWGGRFFGGFGVVLDNGGQVKTPSLSLSKLPRAAADSPLRVGHCCSTHLSERWRRTPAARP